MADTSQKEIKTYIDDDIDQNKNGRKYIIAKLYGGIENGVFKFEKKQPVFSTNGIEDICRSKEELDKLANEITDLKGENERLKGENDEFIKKLKNENEMRVNMIQNEANKNAKLQKDNEKLQKEKEDALADLANKQKEALSKLNQEHADVIKKLNQDHADTIQKLNLDHEQELKTKCQEKDQKNYELINQMNNLKNQLEKKDEIIAELEAELESQSAQPPVKQTIPKQVLIPKNIQLDNNSDLIGAEDSGWWNKEKDSKLNDILLFRKGGQLVVNDSITTNKFFANTMFDWLNNNPNIKKTTNTSDNYTFELITYNDKMPSGQKETKTKYTILGAIKIPNIIPKASRDNVYIVVKDTSGNKKYILYKNFFNGKFNSKDARNPDEKFIGSFLEDTMSYTRKSTYTSPIQKRGPIEKGGGTLKFHRSKIDRKTRKYKHY